MQTNSEFNTGVNTDAHDVARQHEVRLNEAEGILGRYVETDGLSQREAISMSALVNRVATDNRLDMADEGDIELALMSTQEVLKERSVNKLTRLDRVVLDTNGEHGRRAWMATDVPAIVFCAIKSSDKAIKALGKHEGEGGDVRAVAIYFDPTLAGKMDHQQPDGTLAFKPNQYNPDGYTSIVATFTSASDAKQAKQELQRAVATIAWDPSGSALNPDDVRTSDGSSPKRITSL